MSSTIPVRTASAPDAAKDAAPHSRSTRPLVGPKLAVFALVAGALLNGAESIGMRLLLPEPPESVVDRLALVAQHQTTYTVLELAGTLAIPLMGIAFLVLAGQVRLRAPRLGSTAAWLLLAGMWGFAGVHLMNLLQVPFAGVAERAAAASALDAAGQDPVLNAVFLAPFLIGTFVGMVLLVVGLLKTGAMPRWIPITMLAFLVIDFGLRNPGPVDAHWLWIAASLGAAWSMRRSARSAMEA